MTPIVESTPWRCLTVVSALVVMGCDPPSQSSCPDSWAHFAGGGYFDTGSPSMSGDGLFVVYASPRSGHGDIYRHSMDGVDGAPDLELTDNAYFESNPIWSPDGKTIAFEREGKNGKHIWVMDQEARERKLSDGQRRNMLGCFSPDGRWLLFRPVDGVTELHARVVRVDSDAYPIIELGGYAGFDPFSPDSTMVVYDTGETKSGELWLTTLEGNGEPRCIGKGRTPSFSPDGRHILAVDPTTSGSLSVGPWKIMDLDGSHVRRLGKLQNPQFTSDGKHLVYMSWDFKFTLWRLDMETREKTQIPLPDEATGYKTWLRRGGKGFTFSCVGKDRIGDMFFLNEEDWTIRGIGTMK